MRSDPTLRRWFKRINRDYFLGTLPSNVCVRYAGTDEKDKSEGDTCFGWCDDLADGYHSYEIVISRVNNPRLTGRLSTLAHECCHIFLGPKDDDHGPAFEACREMIGRRGIFKKGALAKGLTIF